MQSIKCLQGAAVQTKVMPQAWKSGRNPPDRRLFRPVLIFAGVRSGPVYEMIAENTDASVISAAINGWVGGHGTPDPTDQPKAAAGS